VGVERFKLNSRGVRALLRGPEMQAELKRRAERVVASAGPEFEIGASVGKNRARVAVLARTRKAREAEAKFRRLTRGVDAARGDAR